MNADQNNEPFQKIKKLSDKKFRVQPSGCVVAIEQAKAWTLNCLCVSAVKNYLVSVSAVSAFIRGEFCYRDRQECLSYSNLTETSFETPTSSIVTP